MMTPKKLSTHLLHFAENDLFRPVLHLLLHPETQHQINLNRRTKSGDFLITLLAYAAGELRGNKSERLLALKCLKLVLDTDFTAVNKVASDGGSALHCVLAASSCEESLDLASDNGDGVSGSENDGSEDSDDDDDDDEDGDDSICSDSDDEDADINHEYLQQIQNEAENNQVVHDYCPEYNSLSSQEITLAAIYLLLHNNADPNIPLGNPYGIRTLTGSNSNGDDDLDEEDEMELTFSREAVVQQWTPLMFVMQWIFLASIKCINRKGLPVRPRGEKDGKNGIIEKTLALPVAVLKLLLDYDADKSYMMAGESAGDWNVLQVFSSAFLILHKIKVSKNTISKAINQMYSACTFALSIEDNKVIPFPDRQSEEDGIQEPLVQLIDGIVLEDGMELSPIQSFAVNIITNDGPGALSLMEKESALEGIDLRIIQKEWRSALFEDILPQLQTVWGYSSLNGKTLFDVACSCMVTDAVRALIGDIPLTEYEIRNGIISMFEDLGSRCLSEQGRICSIDNNQTVIEGQLDLVSIILEKGLDKEATAADNLRQRILDRLLLESCTGKMWTVYSPHAALVLVQQGADPNVTSIANKIHDGLTPLHLVAGNCRGTDGVNKLKLLLKGNQNFAAGNLLAMTTSSHDLPIHIALRKRNFSAAETILEAMGEKWTTMKWSNQDADLVGQVATHSADLHLFKQAVEVLVKNFTSSCNSKEDKRPIEKTLGGLLLLVLDERSGFGKVDPLPLAISKIKQAIDIIFAVQSELNLTNLASWARDEISGQNLLHLILRGDRGVELRKELLNPICKLIMASSEEGERILSQVCASKFGGYTPLHLAIALDCEYSVQTLVNLNVNLEAVDAQGKKPIEMKLEASNLPLCLLETLATKKP